MYATMFELKKRSKDEMENARIDANFEQMKTGVYKDHVCPEYVQHYQTKYEMDEIGEKEFLYLLSEGLRYVGVCEISYHKGEYVGDEDFAEDVENAEKTINELIKRIKVYNPNFKISEEGMKEVNRLRKIFGNPYVDFYKNIPSGEPSMKR